MSLSAGFQLNQTCLQDYVDCPRRFELRWLLKIDWPAIESEPAIENERLMQQGARFHRLIQQYYLGLPERQISALIRDPDLARWWENFLLSQAVGGSLSEFNTGGASRYPEIALTTPLGNHRLVAKCDLVQVNSDQSVLILDWKTSLKRPKREWQSRKVQSRLYPFLLCRAGAFLNQGLPIQAGLVRMIYWYAELPSQLEIFQYSEAQYQEDESYLFDLIQRIEGHQPGDFYLTAQEQRCRYCIYRSLCGRGVQAGDMSDREAADAEGGPNPLEQPLEQVAEIEY